MVSIKNLVALDIFAKYHWEVPNGAKTIPWDLGVLNGAGGLRANIKDLMAFARAQLKPQTTPLNKATLLAQEIRLRYQFLIYL